MLKIDISNSYKIHLYHYIFVMLCALFLLRGGYAHEDNANEWIPSGSITVQEYRILFPRINGSSITVLGVLLPFRNVEDEVVVNAGLVPNKNYLNFDAHIQQAFSISLLNIAIRDGGTLIKEECFGEWVTITGTAKLFSGIPAIGDIAFIRKSDSSYNCMKIRSGE